MSFEKHSLAFVKFKLLHNLLHHKINKKFNLFQNSLVFNGTIDLQNYLVILKYIFTKLLIKARTGFGTA